MTFEKIFIYRFFRYKVIRMTLTITLKKNEICLSAYHTMKMLRCGTRLQSQKVKQREGTNFNLIILIIIYEDSFFSTTILIPFIAV